MDQKDDVMEQEYIEKEERRDYPYINEDEVSDIAEKLETNENDPFVYLPPDEYSGLNIDILYEINDTNLSNQLRCCMSATDQISVHDIDKELQILVSRMNMAETSKLSHAENQPVDKQMSGSSETEKLRKSMGNCYVLLTHMDNDKVGKHPEDLSTTQLRRSPRNIRRVCYKDDEDDVDDEPPPTAVRKSPKEKINCAPKTKTAQPARRIARAMSTGASVKNRDNAETEDREGREKADKNKDKNANSPLHKSAINIASTNELQLRPVGLRRSTVHEGMDIQVSDQIEKNHENTVQKSVHVSKNKPRARLTLAMKKWFTEDIDNDDDENIQAQAETRRRSSRTTTRNTDILPGPYQRVTRSMTRNLTEEPQTAHPKRQRSVCSTCYYN